MNEPHRWKDGADAPPAVRELLGAARRSRPMTSAERRRSAGRVANLVSVPVAASLVWVWAKGVAIAGVATLSAVTLVHVSSSHAQAPSMFASAPAATVQAGVSASMHRRGLVHEGGLLDAAAAEGLLSVSSVAQGAVPAPALIDGSPAAASPVEQAAVVAPRRTGAPVAEAHGTVELAPVAAAPAPAPAAADSLEREAGLLEAARAAMAADPARALGLLERHAAEFPRGQLVSERSVMRVDALRRLGRLDEARSDGRALLDSEARLYAPRVRKMIEPAAGTPAQPVAPPAPVAPAPPTSPSPSQ